MSKNKDGYVMRHTLEIRLKNRMFSFMDFKGEMIDYLVKELGNENARIRITDSRIDILSKNISDVLFFSSDNFGFQIEGATSFDSFEQNIKSIFKLVEGFKKYQISTITRVGLRSNIIYQVKSRSFEQIKGIYNTNFLSSYEVLEGKIGNSKISDTGFNIDISKGGGDGHIITGPVSKEEPLEKYFGKNPVYKKFSSSNGFFFDIDYSKQEERDFENLNKLEQESENNLKNLKEILGGFLEHLNIKENE